MKIFSARQLYEADKITVEKQAISSTELMERAASRAVRYITSRFKDPKRHIHIFCGMGNNGGDGLVIGRHLLQQNYRITVYEVRFSNTPSNDFSINLERLKALHTNPKPITLTTALPELEKNAIVIDALFGIGLSRPPTDWVARLIGHINRSGATTIAIDIPSGLYLYATPENPEAVIKASITLTFQAPKLVFFLPQTATYAGEWEVLDIELDNDYLNTAIPEAQLTTRSTLLSWYRPRESFSHKGIYGHALIIGGSHGKTGAVILTAKACITAGAGLVTAYVPESCYTALQTAVPEVMVLTGKGKSRISDIDFNMNPTVIGAGIGLGTHEETQQAFMQFIQQTTTPMVIDADGLNILARRKEALSFLPSKTILTPHPKELERLIGTWKDDFEKLEKTKALARQYDLVIVVKGAYTLITDGVVLYVNPTGNPGMATAGSGDVLTGIITGLLAQGYPPLQAAVFGAYLHGMAGDIAREHTGYEALTAGKIIDFTGMAFLRILE